MNVPAARQATINTNVSATRQTTLTRMYEAVKAYFGVIYMHDCRKPLICPWVRQLLPIQPLSTPFLMYTDRFSCSKGEHTLLSHLNMTNDQGCTI